jgi:hypothetical protein
MIPICPIIFLVTLTPGIEGIRPIDKSSALENQLNLAGSCLERGDQAGALSHLAEYLAARPDQLMIRAYFAELLLRFNRVLEARAQFNRFEADAQEVEEDAIWELIHCHARLVVIAESMQDDYAVHLHRGIGLFLLAQQHGRLREPKGSQATEGFLCRAAAEFSQAKLRRPAEARPCWYLYLVWSRLGQQHPAVRSLREANEAAPFAYLTAVEHRALQRACRELAKN